jgi:hypothetical protein
MAAKGNFRCIKCIETKGKADDDQEECLIESCFGSPCWKCRRVARAACSAGRRRSSASRLGDSYLSPDAKCKFRLDRKRLRSGRKRRLLTLYAVRKSDNLVLQSASGTTTTDTNPTWTKALTKPGSAWPVCEAWIDLFHNNVKVDQVGMRFAEP